MIFKYRMECTAFKTLPGNFRLAYLMLHLSLASLRPWQQISISNEGLPKGTYQYQIRGFQLNMFVIKDYLS